MTACLGMTIFWRAAVTCERQSGKHFRLETSVCIGNGGANFYRARRRIHHIANHCNGGWKFDSRVGLHRHRRNRSDLDA